MAVMSVVTFQVQPGRMDDFLAAARELKGIVERVGVNLTSARLFEAEVAGSRTGRVSLVFEYADLASWGATVDREYQDAAWLALVEQAGGADPPAILVDRSLHTEQPL